MTRETLLMEVIILIAVPAMMYGGLALLTKFMRCTDYFNNQLRRLCGRDMPTGIYIILFLIFIFSFSEVFLHMFSLMTERPDITIAAAMIPAKFINSITNSKDRKTNGLIYLIYLGIVCLIAILISFGIELILTGFQR